MSSFFSCTKGEPDDGPSNGKPQKVKAKVRVKGRDVKARPGAATTDSGYPHQTEDRAQQQKGKGPHRRPAGGKRGTGEGLPERRPLLANQTEADVRPRRPPSMDGIKDAVDDPCGRASGNAERSHKIRKDHTLHIDNSVQILLIGKTGNGKSSVGNRILGMSPPPFQVCTGIISATTQTQLSENFREYDGEKIKVQVVDFPDVVEDDLSEEDRRRETEKCLALTFPFPTAVCLVVRADVRFTPEEYTNYRETWKLLKERFKNNLIVVFTMADKLPPEQRDHFEDQLKATNEQLQSVIRDAKSRYVILGKQDESDMQSDTAMSELLKHVTQLRKCQQEGPKSLSAVVMGATRSGRSATANLLFNHCEPPIFQEECGMAPKGGKSAKASIRGFQLEVVDSSESQNTEQQYEELHDSKPHVIIYVIDASSRFTDENQKQLMLIQQEVGGEDALIIVFTGTDTLYKHGKTLESAIKEGPACLRKIVESVGKSYCSLSKTETTDCQSQTLQRNQLLERMVNVAKARNWEPLVPNNCPRGLSPLSSANPARAGNDARGVDATGRSESEQPGQSYGFSRCSIS